MGAGPLSVGDSARKFREFQFTDFRKLAPTAVPTIDLVHVLEVRGYFHLAFTGWKPAHGNYPVLRIERAWDPFWLVRHLKVSWRVTVILGYWHRGVRPVAYGCFSSAIRRFPPIHNAPQ
jgi:hypothetical protein